MKKSEHENPEQPPEIKSSLQQSNKQVDLQNTGHPYEHRTQVNQKIKHKKTPKSKIKQILQSNHHQL